MKTVHGIHENKILEKICLTSLRTLYFITFLMLPWYTTETFFRVVKFSCYQIGELIISASHFKVFHLGQVGEMS
jgi:hypothetical protein